HGAGVPKGVVNFVGGSGGELGQALVDAKPLKAISFTGSCQIGQWLHAEASKRRLRIQLEMGGKNPTIVLADADFGPAGENVVNAAFFTFSTAGPKSASASTIVGFLPPISRDRKSTRLNSSHVSMSYAFFCF